MENDKKMIAFGPVPSRRLGHSLGINNIPPKICTYSCIYCQVGKTLNMQVKRKEFYKPEEIFMNVERKVSEARQKGEPIDYLTFVPDGEPTLDLNLGEEIGLVKRTGIKIAVITNSSLIWKEDVQDDLARADWVSLKIDAVSQDIWHKINRPYGSLKLNRIVNGISEFALKFEGELTTETMLVQGINDSFEETEKISDFIASINPDKSYLAIPTRPPAEKFVKPPLEQVMNMAYQSFKDKAISTEYLIGFEGDAFAFTGDVERDLLSITSVHPMRAESVKELLSKAKANWEVVERLMRKNKLVETIYNHKKFYLRKFQ